MKIVSTLLVSCPLTYHVPRTRLHLALTSLLHYQYAAESPLCGQQLAVSVWVKNIDRIVPAACRFAVMVEHSIELVMRWL